MSDDNQTEIVVAAAALVVSVVAFGTTLMQCLQQYFGSARGYSHCNPKVMGEWAKTKTRRFSLKELRFEVQFDAPVIFVCPPSNKKGPVPEADVYKLDGTQQSLTDTWTTLNMSQRKDYEDRNRKERIHTSDNERATWTILLSAIQCMEKESREWQEDEFGYQASPSPPQTSLVELGLPSVPPTLENTHSLVVALQRKRKSWDTMPANITKPYATTTMCHLVEMLAAMGVYWKVFDRISDRYRAEGNGFMVLGDRVNDLGLMFYFQLNGMSRFARNRVIPADEIKELCFGWVPTIYRSTQDKRRLEIPLDVLNLSSLQLASRAEISETLTMIGCNNNVTKYFNANRRFSHLFSLSFEILAMLAQTFHIEDTLFTFLPNPTPDRWDSKAVSLPKLLDAFELNFKDELPGRVPRNRTIVDRLKRHAEIIRQYRKDGTVAETLLLFRALHAALNDADEILTGRRAAAGKEPESQGGNARAKQEPQPLSSKTLTRIGTFFVGSTKKDSMVPKPSGLKKPAKREPPGLNEETEKQQRRREMVQDVLRSHIQEVLRLLNEPEERKDQQSLRVPDQNRGRSRDISPSMSSQFDDAPTFEDMDGASPDDRQHIMMDVYFKHIRRRVVPHATRSTEYRRAGRINSPSGRRASPDSQSSAVRSTIDGNSPVATVPVPLQTSEATAEGDDIHLATLNGPTCGSESSRIDGVGAERRPGATATSTPLPSLAAEVVSHDDIWCTLVFRMICWLMLHDFNKLDKQVVKSELLGSRMPVYIA